MFYGPPGTGKTLVARALANECTQGERKVAFFMRKGADCLSKWVGESERQLRLLFDQVSTPDLSSVVSFRAECEQGGEPNLSIMAENALPFAVPGGGWGVGRGSESSPIRNKGSTVQEIPSIFQTGCICYHATKSGWLHSVMNIAPRKRILFKKEV